MVATFSEPRISSLDSELSIPSPINSHGASVQHMPNVLIIPPEEEHEINPPWTYFDAKTDAKTGFSSPDISVLDVALGMFQQVDKYPPVLRRSLSIGSSETVVTPKKPTGATNGGKRSNVKSTMGEDIVEVIKVRKSEGMSDAMESGLKKSKSFRARATQAFKTIKGVASKGSRKSSLSNPNSTDSWPDHPLQSSEDGPEASIFPRPSTPSISQRKSAQFPTILSRKRAPSATTSGMTAVNPDTPESPQSCDFSIISTPTEESVPTLASPLGDRTNQDDERETLNKKRSFRDRVPLLDFQRLFGPSSPRPVPSQESTLILSRVARRDSLPAPPTLPQLSLLSGDEDVFAAHSPLQRPHSFHATPDRLTLSAPNSSDPCPASHPGPEGARVGDDFESEMRLDSLHFDSLHFDPDEFTL